MTNVFHSLLRDFKLWRYTPAQHHRTGRYDRRCQARMDVLHRSLEKNLDGADNANQAATKFLCEYQKHMSTMIEEARSGNYAEASRRAKDAKTALFLMDVKLIKSRYGWVDDCRRALAKFDKNLDNKWGRLRLVGDTYRPNLYMSNVSTEQRRCRLTSAQATKDMGTQTSLTNTDDRRGPLTSDESDALRAPLDANAGTLADQLRHALKMHESAERNSSNETADAGYSSM